MKWLHHRPFSGRLPTISEYSNETFFLESVLLKSEIQDCRSLALEKKGHFRKDIFGIFEILEYLFLFEHFQNVSVA